MCVCSICFILELWSGWSVVETINYGTVGSVSMTNVVYGMRSYWCNKHTETETEHVHYLLTDSD